MSKYTKSSKGQECTVWIPEGCRGKSDFARQYTVPAHLNGGGMGLKHLDIFIADACDYCHWWLDVGYANLGIDRAVRDLWHMQAIFRTQIRMVKDGTLKL